MISPSVSIRPEAVGSFKYLQKSDSGCSALDPDKIATKGLEFNSSQFQEPGDLVRAFASCDVQSFRLRFGERALPTRALTACGLNQPGNVMHRVAVVVLDSFRQLVIRDEVW